jgi:large subunit ribosomal protein L18
MRRKVKYVMPHRRRREGKTDYRLRLKLLKSRKPRFVVRKSNKNVICQVIKYEEKGDKTIASAEASELKHFGWYFNSANLPSAYLTGLLCAQRAKKHKIKELVFDIGLYAKTRGNILFAALKGALDGGMEIPYNEEILPSDDRICGKHIVAYAEKLKGEDPAKYRKQFSGYLKAKLEIKDLPLIFENVKNKILETKGEKVKKHMDMKHKTKNEKTDDEKAHIHIKTKS